jgi:hypothetical protein
LHAGGAGTGEHVRTVVVELREFEMCVRVYDFHGGRFLTT